MINKKRKKKKRGGGGGGGGITNDCIYDAAVGLLDFGLQLRKCLSP